MSWKKKHIYRGIVISYIIIIVVPLIFSVLIYQLAVSAVEKETEAGNILKIDYIRSIIDSEISNMTTRINSISLASEVKDFPEDYRQMRSSAARYSGAKLSARLNTYIPDNRGVLSEVLVYYYGGDSFISDKTVYSGPLFDYACKEFFGTGPEDFKMYAGTLNIRRTVFLDKPDGTESVMYSVSPIFDMDKFEFTGLVIGYINLERVKNIFAEYLFEGESGFIYGDGGLFTVAGDGRYMDVIGAGLASTAEPYSSRLSSADGKIVLTSVGAELGRWNYLTIVPSRVYLSGIYRLWGFVGGYVVLCLLFGAVLSRYFARRYYTPLEKLMGVVSRRRRQDDRWKNEFLVLEEAINELMEEVKDQDRTIEKQRSALRNELLKRLYVPDRVSSLENTLELLAAQDVLFEYDRFVLVLIMPTNPGEIFGEDGEDEQDYEDLSSVVIRSIFTEMLERIAQVFFVDMSIGYSLLLSVSDAEGVFDEICGALEGSSEFIGENFGLMLRCVVSPEIIGAENIESAYSEAGAVFFSKKNVTGIIVLGRGGEQSGPEVGGVALHESVAGYIDRHFDDPGLCMDTVSLRFGVSASHIARTFKQNHGVTVLDYIHRRRMEEVKRLLSETNQTIKAIADSTGYTNTWTLSRTFRKYFGMSPGEFRSGQGDKQ